LLKLTNLLLQLSGIHRILPHLIDGLMGGLELCLEILVGIEDLLHFFIDKELIGDKHWYQKSCGICAPLKLRHFGKEPEKQVLNGSLFTMNQLTLERGIEVSRIAKHLEETTDSLLSLILSLSLDVDCEMGLIEVS
jgi:hypothetical protein